MMEAQQAQAIQQSQNQSSPWGSSNVPAPSSSTPNNSALPNPWGAIPASTANSPYGMHLHIYACVCVCVCVCFLCARKLCICRVYSTYSPCTEV